MFPACTWGGFYSYDTWDDAYPFERTSVARPFRVHCNRVTRRIFKALTA